MSPPDRAEVGSSSSRMRGLRNTARAISIFWRCGRSSVPTSTRDRCRRARGVRGGSATSCAPAVGAAGRRRYRGVGQQHVVGDREVAHEADLLEGGLDAEGVGVRGTVQMHGLAEDPDSAEARPDEPRQQLDGRRLAGAVLAQERVDLPGADAERGAAERERRARRPSRPCRACRASTLTDIARDAHHRGQCRPSRRAGADGARPAFSRASRARPTGRP